MGINEIKVEERDGKVFVSTPYDPAFVSELKNKTKSRQWDALQKCWVLDVSEKGTVEELVSKYFKSAKEYASINGTSLSMSDVFIEYPPCHFVDRYAKNLGASISVDERRGITKITSDKADIIEFVKSKVLELLSKAGAERIYVAHIWRKEKKSYIVWYDRDNKSIRSSPLFRGLAIKRIGSHGVRRSPEFEGFVAIITKFPIDTIEDMKDVDYVELPDTPEVRVAVKQLVESAEDWNVLKQKLEELKSAVPVKKEEKREPTLEELIVEKQQEIELLKQELRKKEEELRELLQKFEAEKIKRKFEEMKQKIV